MSIETFTFGPIGLIRTPFASTDGMPIQPVADAEAEVVIDPKFEAGLADIEGFSHLVLIYVFHLSANCRLSVVPYLDSEPHGVFATRAPTRPNPIGVSLTRLVSRSGNLLRIRGIDVVDGTPLLDLKPHVPSVDTAADVRIGWMQGKEDGFSRVRADGRFKPPV